MVHRHRLKLQVGPDVGKIEIITAAPAGTSAAGIRPRRATALALPGLTLLLIATAPQANGSRAKRRHPNPHVGLRDLSAVSGLTRTQSSIPGVSIWTSKEAVSRLQPRRGAAAAAAAAAIDDAVAPSSVDSDVDAYSGGIAASRLSEKAELKAGSVRTGRIRRRRSRRSSGVQSLPGGDCQDGSGNIGDADVEPPSRGAREEEEELEEEYAAGVMTTEEGEEDTAQGNADAAPGRMLEEGGGSDSQEDESEDDDESNNNGGADSYDNGSGDSESDDDDDDEGLFRGGTKGWGRGGVVRGRYGRGLQQLLPKGETEDGEGGKRMVSLAKKYEVDEEACFARVKELWQDRIEPPLSSVEVEEISETVRNEQKKLLESAPTEWNSGLRRTMGGRRTRRASKGVVMVEGGIAQEEVVGGSSGGDDELDNDDYDEEEDSMTSLELLHRLLLAEMRGEGASGGLNNRWIDRDALLQLRGAATLAHHPEYLRHTANLPRVTRGVRLVAPEATHSMQEAFARSLGHSTGSNVVFLDSMALDAVRHRALAEGIPKDRLSSRQLTSALLELAGEGASPFVVFLTDKGSVALKSRGVCHRLTEELKSQSSRVLFLLSTTSDPSVPGNDASFGTGDGSSTSPGDASQLQQQQQSGGGGMFGSGAFQWPPGQQHMSTGQSKRSFQQDGPKKNYIFLQQTPPNGENRGYFGGRSPRGGRGSRSEGGRGQPGQGFGRGMPGPPIPPQMLEQLLREAMKSMKEAGEQASNKNGEVSNNSDHNGVVGDGGSGSGGDIPPGLLEALGEALNDDDFKNALEQIGKQLSKDINQGFSIMFSTSAAAPPGGGNNQGIGNGNGEGDEEDAGDGGDGESSMPWSGTASASAAGNPGSSQSSPGSPSLSWLTNLRKGIMSGDEAAEGDEGNEENYEEGDEERGSGGGVGNGSSGGGEGRKPDSRRGVDLPPSGTEMRTFTNLFEDVAVEPPQDAILRQHWDAWVKEDVGKHSARHNKQALTAALRRNALACPELERLKPLLARHRLTEAETGQVVLSALKVELSKAAVYSDGLNFREGDDAPPEPLRTSKGRLVISRQSMETAFAAVCKAYVPRPGQPMSRTREEVAALTQSDRHEQALVTNVILPKDIGVTYDMIGGLGGAKELLRQCITYPLRFPHLYSEGIAKEAVKGVLLFGPPGTGKTMLAKAVATEGGATFLSVDASVIENKWLGESEKNARAVFTLARRLAPCVVFIDEVDSVLSSREKYDDTTHGTLTSVKTTLMQEWDGLRTGGDRVVVIASTNRPFDLDEAVLRRLPRRILVDLPDAETREEILRVSMAQNRVDASVNFTAITAELEGFTGSDIKEVCREAVVRIAHEKANELDKAGEGGVPGEDIDLTVQLRPVTMDDFREARKKLTASVSEKGRELAKVWEWNEEYGEVKKKRSDASAPHLSMYT